MVKYREMAYDIPYDVMEYCCLVDTFRYYSDSHKRTADFDSAFLIGDMHLTLMRDRRGLSKSTLLLIADPEKKKPEFLNDLLEDPRVHYYKDMHSERTPSEKHESI